MKKIKVLSIFGTRPEVIKMAPVIREMERRSDFFDSKVIITGQHREMCLPYLKLFSINPYTDLSIMEADQTLNTIVINILRTLPKYIKEISPDLVLVQGDTTSAFAASVASFHDKVNVGHIEAGLRTKNKYNPYPEEMNRQLVSVLADLHFAPTLQSQKNLRAEGIPDEKIFITGNTVIDAMKMIIREDHKFSDGALSRIDFQAKRVICVTTHRRESFGEPLQNTLKALKKIMELHPDTEIVIPVHYNPNVKKSIFDCLGKISRIHLIDPLPYEEFVQLLNLSYLILTDSGGIQEEAPSLGKPLLVLRDTTERPEGVAAGTAKLVGTDIERIISGVSDLLNNKESYSRMSNAQNPYGDGNAAAKIVDIIQNKFM